MKTKHIIAVFILATLFGLNSGYFFVFFRNQLNRPLNNNINNNNSITSANVLEAQTQNSASTFNYHYSSFGQKNFFEAYFKDSNTEQDKTAKQIVKNKNIKVVVVPHHLLAGKIIASAFAHIASDQPVTVVVISPNHFFAGRGQIISSLYDWQTPYGILPSDKDLIKQLQTQQLLNIDERPFAQEHGISNLTAFIKKVLPNARVIPLIVKDTVSFKESDFFADNISKILPADTLFVASIDFSHYLPSQMADFHDAKSLAVLTNFDYDGINFLDIDSKPSLRILLKYLEAKGANTFNLAAHSNSAYILKNENISETTSYISGFFSLGDYNKIKQATILALGDVMLDRYVKNVIDKKGQNYPWQNIARVLNSNDITLSNLEGSFTDFLPKPLKPDNVSFTFDPDLILGLKKIGFNIFNLANNHTLDFGAEGLAQSQAYLKNNQINYFGDPRNSRDLSVIKNVRGLKIGFIGYNELSRSGVDNILAEIKKIKQEVDLVIVYTHWGIEYQTNFSREQQAAAHQFIDAGADVVLGSHPHVIEPIEVYKNKIIFYSLGNFLFDQMFSAQTRQGLSVGIVFSPKQIDYYLFLTENKNMQINLLNKEKSDIMLVKIADKSIVSDDIKKQIIQGKISINF